MEKIRIGIDLGGTKTEVIALDIGGEELFRKRVSTIANDYAASIETVVALVNETENFLKSSGTVGIGTPGAISPRTGLIKNGNSTWLNGKPFKTDLEAALGRPVKMANDANCFALSESIDGSAADGEVVFGVILGTGAGGGIVVSKHILVGPNAIAGEWGHNPLPWPDAEEVPGPACFCGKSGCVETFLSGPGLARDYAQLYDEDKSAHDIAALAVQGNENAGTVMERYERRLAKSLASVINVIDPDIVVLGGGLSNIERLYRNVPKLWLQYIFSDDVLTRLVPPRYGDSSGVRGAAWLWNDG